MIIRNQYLQQLIQFKDTDFIKVISGVRRSGKSILLMQYQDYLQNQGIQAENIIYLNFESFEYQWVKNADDFQALITQKIPNNSDRIYFLIDEIQFVENWQKIINAVRVSFNTDIVITGSNANLLSGELATLLSGRYVEIKVYPLSFKEFLQAKNIDPQSRFVDQAYVEYEKYGGFPSVVLADEMLKDTILSGIFDSIVLNDIAHRASVRDTHILKNVILFLADNVGQLVNPSKISNTLTSERVPTSNHTINKYLELLENAFLFYKAKQYDIRGKGYLKTNAKYFIVDNGLRRYAVGQKDANYSNRLENIVFLELLRRGYMVDVGKLDSKEIDFIARKSDEILYVQVAYDIPNNTHETDNLLHIRDNYRKILITGRYQPEKEIDGVPVVYVVDWLLE
ncbi:ATP-binding protein [Actinobacillus equuli]|uniref:ATP-binding protein n=1 Tax=Actinobacillus equuli TaxID=718 RepID=UPI00244255BE|nr:ATP-binding protein [Actinobacillus equuli]WGE84979.1 ATP-binding protein [Actinobacillus equuli subsp. haemolyticus]